MLLSYTCERLFNAKKQRSKHVVLERTLKGLMHRARDDFFLEIRG